MSQYRYINNSNTDITSGGYYVPAWGFLQSPTLVQALDTLVNNGLDLYIDGTSQPLYKNLRSFVFSSGTYYLSLKEGDGFSIIGSVFNSGTLQWVDSSGSVLQTWVINNTQVPQITQFTGTQKFILICSSGTINVNVQDSSLSSAKIVNSANGSIAGLTSPDSGGAIVRLQAELYPMRKWAAALGQMRNGIRNARLLLIGDSTGVGSGASGSTGFTADSRKISFSPYLAKQFIALGIPAYAEGVCGDRCNSSTALIATFDPRFVIGSAVVQESWATLNNALAGRPFKFSTTTTNNQIDFTPSVQVDTYELHWVSTTTTGKLNYGINGGGTTTEINTTSGGADTVYRSIIPAGSLGANTLNVTWKSGSSWNLSFDAYNSTVKGIQIIEGCWAGSRVADFLYNTKPWSALNMLSALSPDLIHIQLQINDVQLGTALSTYITNLQTLITAAKAVGDVIISSGYPSSIAFLSTTVLSNQKLYRDSIAALCLANNVYFDDLWGRMGSYEIQQSYGAMYADALHPTGSTYAYAAKSKAMLLSLY